MATDHCISLHSWVTRPQKQLTVCNFGILGFGFSTHFRGGRIGFGEGAVKARLMLLVPRFMPFCTSKLAGFTQRELFSNSVVAAVGASVMRKGGGQAQRHVGCRVWLANGFQMASAWIPMWLGGQA